MTTPQLAGVALALSYLAVALYVVIDERQRSSFLPTMGTALVRALRRRLKGGGSQEWLPYFGMT